MDNNFINHKIFNYVKSEWGEMIRTPKEGKFFAETEGGVFYTAQEMKIVSRAMLKVSQPVNMVKEVFGGEIVECSFLG